MKDRIQRLLEEKKISASKLAEKLEVQPSGISHILSGRNKPGMDFIVKCLNAFPDINPEWFVLGTGPMYRASSDNIPTTDTNDMEKKSPLHLSVPEPSQGDININAPTNDKDLFSSDDYFATTKESFQKSTQPETRTRHTENDVSSRRHICRVMIFYSDHTVESFDYSEKE